MSELSSFDGGKDNQESTAYVAIRGVVFDFSAFIPAHYPDIVPAKSLRKYSGKDATGLFPVQVSALCPGIDEKLGVNRAVQLGKWNATEDKSVDPNARYHDFRYASGDPRKDWFLEQMSVLRKNYRMGDIGYSPEDIQRLADSDNRHIGWIGDKVYDMTEYSTGARLVVGTPGQDKDELKSVDTDFMDSQVEALFSGRKGQDLTKYWDTMNMNVAKKQRMKTCLDRLFFIGKLDTRNSPQCQFARYLLLAISMLLVAVILFKFLAALQFGHKNMPENLDKFIICQVPAYTEDEDSLRRAMDSVARMKYDDKRKLLVVVCDGMIIGQGNDRPTPRIVLDILGVSESVDPEPLSFESLGEGQKQHNMAKVYSGLYEVMGHIVPFLVIVKVGKPAEMTRSVHSLFIYILATDISKGPVTVENVILRWS